MSQYYKEWSSKVENRRGRMVPLSAFEILLKQADTGYATVYMFREEDALAIKATGASKGMNQYPVAADCLTIDIDTGDEGLKQAEEALRGYAYEVWNSGGKGYHLVLPHTLVESPHLPYSHLKAVQALGVRDYDPTLYQHARLISLPGRVHAKTRRKKALVRRVDGHILVLKLVEKPEPKFDFGGERAGMDALTSGLMRFVEMGQAEPRQGMRHTSVWGACKDLAEGGLSYDTALDIAQAVNAIWEHPKAEDEIETAVRQAYNG